MSKNDSHAETSQGLRQFITFSLDRYNYAIDVLRVQEVTTELNTTTVPLAPNYVKGLVNLRGQVSTAIDLNELFCLKKVEHSGAGMMVVCKIDGQLISLIVDKIGDVVEIPQSSFEQVPDTVSRLIKSFLSGIYKTEDTLLSVVDIDKLANQINNNEKQENMKEIQ